MKKKAISLLLAIVLVLGIIPVPVQAASSPNVTWFGNAADYKDLLDAQYPQGVRYVYVDGKNGMINKYGKMVVPNAYDDLEILDDGMIVATIGKKEGLIDKTGKLIIPVKYDSVKGPSIPDGIYHVTLAGQHGFYNKEGKLLGNTMFDYAYDFNDGACIVKKDGAKGMGVINTDGKLVHDYIYKEIGQHTRNEFWGGVAVAKNQEGWYGVIDTKGKIVSPFIYNGGWDLDMDQGPKASFKRAEDYIIPEAKCIIITKDTAPLYGDGRKQPGRFGVIDFNGKIIVPFKYALITYLQNEKAFSVPLPPELHKNDPTKSAFIVDLNGKVLTPASGYTGYKEMTNGVRIASKNKKYGGLNAQNKEVVKFIYDQILPFNSSGTAWARMGTKWGLISKVGKTIVPFEYTDVEPDAPEKYSEALNARADVTSVRNMPDALKKPDDRVFQPNVWFTISGQTHSAQTGRDVIVRADPFTGIARVTKDKKMGYISPTGKIITPCIYSGGKAFDAGVALTRKLKANGGYEYFLIDTNGKVLNTNPNISYITRYQWGTRMFYTNKPNLVEMGNSRLLNYLTIDGKILLKDSSHYAKEFSEGLAQVYPSTDSKDFGYIDNKGRWVIPSGTYSEAQVAYNRPFIFIVDNSGRIGYMLKKELAKDPSYVEKPAPKVFDKETLNFTSSSAKLIYKTGDAFDITEFKAELVDVYNKTKDITSEITFKNGDVELYKGYIWQNPGNQIISCYYKGKVEHTFKLAVESTDVLTDGVYTLSGMNNYFSTDTKSGLLTLQDKKPIEQFTIKSTGDAYTIESSKSGYLTTSMKKGYQIDRTSKPQKWKINKINGDKYVIRAIDNENYVMNVQGEKSENGTKVNIWEIFGAVPVRNQIKITPVK